MDFDKKDGSSYLDGIPLKISSAFLPPPPVLLPPLLNTEEWPLEKFQYDFSLEKKALECINEMREKKKEAESKMSQPENMCNKLQNPSPVPSNMQTLFSLQSDDILLPKTKKNLDKVSNSEQINSSKINLSDFENDMSSPFDYMELQTINDLEELSNVFQGLNNKYNSDGAVCKEKNLVSSGPNQNSVVTCSFSKSMSFPLENNDSFEGSEMAAQKETPKENCHPNLEDDDSRLLQQAFSATVPSFVACPSVRNNNNNVPDKSSLRICKSYSDIHNLTSESSNTTTAGRSSTPPAMDTASKTLSVQEETPSEIVNCDNLPGLPDPYDELPEEDRRFVDAIADMGFPRAQVSRTVRHLGMDEKMVVEHLCQIQSLEESGYDCLEAEAALHLHDYKQDQAKKFLDLINKFQDLGFEKDAVKKALIQNKNDWSKTIDALLS